MLRRKLKGYEERSLEGCLEESLEEIAERIIIISLGMNFNLHF